VRTATIDDSMMRLCVDAVRAIADCPPASLRQFPLSAYHGMFSGVDAVTFDSVNFRVARSGDTLVLLSAQPSPTPTAAGRTFQVGLSTNSGMWTGTFEGGDTLGRWGTLDLAPASSSLRETLARPDGPPLFLDGPLSPLADAPAGLAAGMLDAAPIWLAQDGPLAVAIGRPGTSIDGLLQLFLR